MYNYLFNYTTIQNVGFIHLFTWNDYFILQELIQLKSDRKQNILSFVLLF